MTTRETLEELGVPSYNYGIAGTVGSVRIFRTLIAIILLPISYIFYKYRKTAQK